MHRGVNLAISESHKGSGPRLWVASLGRAVEVPLEYTVKPSNRLALVRDPLSAAPQDAPWSTEEWMLLIHVLRSWI